MSESLLHTINLPRCQILGILFLSRELSLLKMGTRPDSSRSPLSHGEPCVGSGSPNQVNAAAMNWSAETWRPSAAPWLQNDQP